MFKRHASLLLTLCAPALVALFAPGSAVAVVQSPQWTVTAISAPTNIPAGAGSTGFYNVEVRNTGGAASDGSTITVTDVLPSGLVAGAEGASGTDRLTDRPLSCTGVTCTYTDVVPPDDALRLKVPVEVAAGAPASVTNSVSVSGGGAPEGLVQTPTAISSTPAPFGIAPGSLATVLSSNQAGGHPDLTTIMAFTLSKPNLNPENAKELVTDLPPGFAGDLADTPTCSPAIFSKQEDQSEIRCPISTQVGVITVRMNFGYFEDRVTTPVNNLTPNPGEVARMGFYVAIFGIQGTISLRPGDYGLHVTFQNINESLAQIQAVALSVWGVPSDPSHDAMRGAVCGEGSCEYYKPHAGRLESAAGFPLGSGHQPEIGGLSSTTPAIPYLTSPTQCTGEPLVAKFSVTTWEHTEQQATASSGVGPLTGCGLLAFDPAITAAPDTTRADTPAGFTFEVRVSQEGLVNPEGLSTSDIQDTTVTLPVGVAINPGQANGLAVCEPSQAAIGVEGPPTCPSSSRVGHVEIETPILKHKLEGEVYVLASNPPDLKVLVVAADPADGIWVKLQGDIRLDETTGQLVTTFKGTPELPFSDLKLSFSGGAQAALTTPLACGQYSTKSDFTPWSSPFTAEASPSSSFAVNEGPGGSACPSSPAPFTPAMIAGASTDQAGGFTSFSMLLSRSDGQQRISTLQFKVPEGLLGMISKVPLCGEPQAQDGECPAASQIGHTVVEAGPGPYPLVVPQPGQPPAPIYLTGPYEGAPYGLSIVVPLHVGPFVLKTQVVRAKIEVDPLTSQLTVTTSPLPQIIDGVPADLRTINAVIDRPGFMFNPTNCSPMAFSGTATSTEGASAPISSHFQVGSCQSLKFKPDFKVSTSGKTSRANGASLDVKLSYSKGAFGKEANIRSVKVDLPKQLPSRLTTLQKACADTVYNVNPAACPAASRVGTVTTTTPVLPVALSGPVYFVSHGVRKFPDLVVILQGYGVTVTLDGETFISKTGITSTTFRTVPDVPFESFELKLPQGPYSALAANGNLCKQKLLVPTRIVAQNGAVISQSTKIAVGGCAKPKVKKPAKRKKK